MEAIEINCYLLQDGDDRVSVTDSGPSTGRVEQPENMSQIALTTKSPGVKSISSSGGVQNGPNSDGGPSTSAD